MLCLAGLCSAARAQDHHFDPPWNTPPESKVQFTVPGIDNVPDLFGDINDPQLVVFFAGNQFMVMDSLLAAFKRRYPQYRRIFVETLPPGILAKQIEAGSLTIGNLRIRLKPDVYTAGKGRIDQMPDLFTQTKVYAYNRLALMVQKGNPQHITGMRDLQRKTVRISMPNPAWEGVAAQIQAAYVKAGGASLRKAVMETKVNDSSTFLTRIHHRESPMRILYGQSDAAPVWYTEVRYQQSIGHPVEEVQIPEKENVRAVYMAGQMKNAPHPEAARDFMNFITGPEAAAIYRSYGFTTPE
ncbi:substrate-binding domain-containing protein [Compostibacter hankyongensis]|uniref:Substrate-binding domain-containing protein n=2 Tax=Compostibacter hankyongensis TaxID=1007089 RepID=A0ABP8G0S0_9BACT